MSNDEGMTNPNQENFPPSFGHLNIWTSFDIRHSWFVIPRSRRRCCRGNQQTKQPRVWRLFPAHLIPQRDVSRRERSPASLRSACDPAPFRLVQLQCHRCRQQSATSAPARLATRRRRDRDVHLVKRRRRHLVEFPPLPPMLRLRPCSSRSTRPANRAFAPAVLPTLWREQADPQANRC